MRQSMWTSLRVCSVEAKESGQHGYSLLICMYILGKFSVRDISLFSYNISNRLQSANLYVYIGLVQCGSYRQRTAGSTVAVG